MKNLYIVVDFDGTCVTHEFPKVGRNIGAEIVLKSIVESGHKIILHTMRGSEHIKPALEWFEQNNIPLFGVNENPTQRKWTNSSKTFANLYIDDSAVGTPLVCPLNERPYVDWEVISAQLWGMGVITYEQHKNNKELLLNEKIELPL